VYFVISRRRFEATDGSVTERQAALSMLGVVVSLSPSVNYCCPIYCAILLGCGASLLQTNRL